MKTSILVSSFAALCLLITYGESSNRFNTENDNALVVSNVSCVSANRVIAVTEIKLSANKTEKAEVKTNVTLVEDFCCLKFNVADYMNDNELATFANAENSLDNLKFDVNKYSESDKTAFFEEMDLPVNDFQNLKFNVSKYTDMDEMNSDNIRELPVYEFSYLKFDVNKYAAQSNMKS